MVLGQVVLALGQVVLVSDQVVLVLGVGESDKEKELERDQSDILSLFCECCKRTSRNNVCHFASSMSMRCIQRVSHMLCNKPSGSSLGQRRRH